MEIGNIRLRKQEPQIEIEVDADEAVGPDGLVGGTVILPDHPMTPGGEEHHVTAHSLDELGEAIRGELNRQMQRYKEWETARDLLGE